MDELNYCGPILHVVVVGFHHKKGCQVEYSYPPLITGNSVDSHEVPEEWKHLPSLALPDGAHNYTKDTVFFHLVSKEDHKQTVYGVSCYRQIDTKDLLHRSADVTRSSVQKSVCVLSRLPLYGVIQAKLEMITHAYFEERDFSQVSLLQETYMNLVASFPSNTLDTTQTLHGLSARELVLTYRHKILVLFKLLLLERRVLVYGTPVHHCSNTVLSLLSLFPDMIDRGLAQSASHAQYPKLSSTLQSLDSESDFLEVKYHERSCDSPTDEDPSLTCQPASCSVTHPVNTLFNEEPGIADQTKHSIAAECPYIGQKNANPLTTNKSTHNEFKSSDNRIEEHSTNSHLISMETDLPANAMDSPTLPNREINYNASQEPSVNSRGKHGAESNTHAVKSTVDRQISNRSIISFDDVDVPLANIDNITNTEVVQESVTFDYTAADTIALQTLYDETNKKPAIRLASLDDSLQIQPEEIDSPASISLIDQEDCFSWDDDMVTLEIDQERTNTETSDATTEERPSDRERSTSTFYVDFEDAKGEKVAYIDHLSLVSSNGKAIESITNKSNPDGSSDKTVYSRSIRNRLVSVFANLSKIKQDDYALRVKHLSDCEGTKHDLGPDQYGFPLAIFTKGALCHPYLSLQFYDLLNDINVRSFLIGANNILFRQRKHAVDVILDLNDPAVVLEFHDTELKKQLALSTADLRFADYIVRIVQESMSGTFLDDTEWDGGDEWIRAQFKTYLQALLSASIHPDTKHLEDFQPAFVSVWSTTRNYRVWQKLDHSVYKDISPCHPCHGNLSVNDLKVKFTTSLQGTDKGRRINSAVSQTGKYVMQTGKAVGGALTSAKTAVSSWFSSLGSD